MSLIPAGRTDLDEYFKNAVLCFKKLNHTPLLAFVASGENIVVQIISVPSQVADLPDDTPIMGQWRGE
jgi:hypothetical protein